MASTASKSPPRSPAVGRPAADLTPLHRAIVLTVLYSDLFDYPLTDDELYRYAMAPCPDRADFNRAIAALEGPYLSRAGGFICRAGRERTAEVRRRRQGRADRRWLAAWRFARWLGAVPFLRMVAVCGSQAVDNGGADGDVDLFLITEPNRLWLVQSTTMVLRRAGRLLLGIEICPNYLLTTAALRIEEHNLYTAREVAQTVPLWGEELHAVFLAENRWIRAFLPQADLGDRGRFLRPVRRPPATRALEKLLGGRLGDLLDRWVHRLLLVYYRLRLRRHSWRKEQIEKAYRRDRQMVVTGGYATAVAEHFVDRALRDHPEIFSREELMAWFYGPRGTTHRKTPAVAPADPLYSQLLAARYGAAGD